MKNNSISKWAALLLTVSGMAALPLTLKASFTETGTSVTASGLSAPSSGTATSTSFNSASGVFRALATGTIWAKNNTTITVTGDTNVAVQADHGSNLAPTGGVIIFGSGAKVTVAGSLTRAVLAHALSSIFLSNAEIVADGIGTVGVIASGGGALVTFNGGTIAVTGAEYAQGARAEDAGVMQLDNVVINASSGSNARGLTAWNRGKVYGNNVQLNVDNGWAIHMLNDATVSLNNSSITTTGTQTAIEFGASTWQPVTNDGASTLELNNTNVAAEGTLITANGNGTMPGQNQVLINGGTMTAGGDAVNASGQGNLAVGINNGALTGNVNSSGSSTVIITGSNGSTVTGTATSKDDSSINVNISGPGSSWLGDVNQNDNGKIIVNLDHGATGIGGFNGGDLTVGGGSEWKFDKDSHVNNGKNNGTLDIGDHTVKFDNLENNGKIVINVNTDSGIPKGSVEVTGSGSGNGHIDINTSGNGSGNPDDILNGIVKGPGTDGWIWDPIDWGLEELIVTPNADGTVSISQSGKSSTVSALTQGLVAAQKNSWFAQQDSLLKRMGELRLNAHRTTNISGKDDGKSVSVQDLISNIWIKGYGAQYNYGAQVTGRSFKQYVYGVDIGTDHKWTLNADNDLYTGLFVGYGRADTDHRYNGSESNLNNYYAGVYASWLNIDGWYADATLKAQYSDHELSGYHGGIDYFSAKYNNWSIGGSIEIGRQFKFEHDWFIETQLQADYLHMLADDYSVSAGQQLAVSELDAFQLRAGIVMGRTLKLRSGGALQPYVKISGVEMLSTGGDIKSGYQSQRPNLDGARAELGGGIIWQVDANNQLHLDYEASFGDKYDKPWGLTAGYRYQF